MSNPVQVLVPTMYYPPSVGGVQRVARGVAANMPSLRVKVVCPAYPGDAEYDAAAGSEITRLPVGAARHHRLAVVLFNALAPFAGLDFHPDVVLSPHVLSASGAALSARLTRAPLVQYLHAEEMTRRPGMSRAAIRAATMLITLSGHTEKLARALGADPSRMRRIPPGTSLPPTPQRRRDGGPPTVVTVSRLEDRFKGHDVMIDALPRVLTEVPDMRWLV